MGASPKAAKYPQPKDQKIGMWLDASRIHHQFKQSSHSLFESDWPNAAAWLPSLADRAFGATPGEKKSK